jgi:hypothetical protein
MFLSHPMAVCLYYLSRESYRPQQQCATVRSRNFVPSFPPHGKLGSRFPFYEADPPCPIFAIPCNRSGLVGSRAPFWALRLSLPLKPYFNTIMSTLTDLVVDPCFAFTCPILLLFLSSELFTPNGWILGRHVVRFSLFSLYNTSFY